MGRNHICLMILILVGIPVAQLSAQTPEIGSVASLSNDFHNVGGTVTVLDEDTLQFDAFTYDGQGLSVFFYLGAEDTSAAFSNGLSIGDELLGMPFDGTQSAFTVDLPMGETIDGYHAISVWCVAVGVSFGSGTFESAGLACDFNGDQLCDADDVNLLNSAIVAVKDGGLPDMMFDVNGDGVVDDGDLVQWRADAGVASSVTGGNPFLPADANLDGVVDVRDFNIWNSEKFTESSDFTSGDFNSDGDVDVSDLNIWNANKFQSSASGAAAAPEPSSMVLIVIAMLGGIGWSRKLTGKRGE